MNYKDFESKLLPCRNKNLLLGFSGGADSCALFLILAYWRDKIPFNLTAIHFEHGIRGAESLKDAEFCRMTAEKYNIPFRQYSLNVMQNILKNETMESAARRLRLNKYKELINDFDNAEIHLAHHRDDLTENVFLRLFRGANSSGLSGLREYSILDKMPIRRILLDFSRSDIEDFLKSQNFSSYCTDMSNFDCDISRNFLRNKLLVQIHEHFPYAAKGIAQSAAACNDDADFIEECARNEYEKIRDMEQIQNSFWQSLHKALLVRVLRMYFSNRLNFEYIPDKNLINRFEQSLKNKNSLLPHKIELDNEYFYVRRNNIWQLEKKQHSTAAPIIWNCLDEPETIFGNYKYNAAPVEEMVISEDIFYFALDELTLPLQITMRTEGETFEKFGGTHTSVKKELTDRKICGSDRDNVGILRNGNGEILLIGDFRRSSFAPIYSKNQKIIKISVEKIKK